MSLPDVLGIEMGESYLGHHRIQESFPSPPLLYSSPPSLLPSLFLSSVLVFSLSQDSHWQPHTFISIIV